MMTEKKPIDYKNAIRLSGKNIYSQIEVGDANYWIPTKQLEVLLNEGLDGLSLAGLPLRTRSKVVKSAVCEALGYPIPKSFKKTQPRFLGQQLDIYTQKSLNLQIWNEELSPTRRYAIIKISEEDVIHHVKVVNGQELAQLDTTGTITKKYQACLDIRSTTHELISAKDTPNIEPYLGSSITGAFSEVDPNLGHCAPGMVREPYMGVYTGESKNRFSKSISPIAEPESGSLLPIHEIFERLSPLVGMSFPDPGMDQERNRGAALHKLVCERLGYSRYEDNGQFPDIRHQLLEIKLQTSPTIDLGLVLPNSEERIDIRQIGMYHPSHCDTRYAMFYARTDGIAVTLTHLFVCTGAEFFNRFRRFEGRVINGKLQIPLPRNFFTG